MLCKIRSESQIHRTILNIFKNTFFRREETIKTKYLVYKGCKKNVHRLWKLNGDKGKAASSTSSGHNGKYAKTGSLFSSGLNGRDDEKMKRITDQTIQENIRTTEKMNQLRLKMELANARKKLKSIKFPLKIKPNKSASDLAIAVEKLPRKFGGFTKELHENGVEKPMMSSSTKVKQEQFNDKVIQRQLKQERFLSAESKMKIKENLSRNRSFKTILSPPTLASSSSLSFFNSDVNPLEFCFSGSTGDVMGPSSSNNKLGRSLSFQSNYVFNRTDSNLCVNNGSGVNSLATMESTTISNSTPIIQEYVESICEPERVRAIGTKAKDSKKSAFSTSMQDLLLKEFLTKTAPRGATASSTASTSGRDYSNANLGFAPFNKRSSKDCAFTFNNNDERDVLKGATTKAGPSGEINEYFILPKLFIREDSPSVLNSPRVGEEVKAEDSDGKQQPSAESLIEFYDNLTSSSTSSLVSKMNDFGCFPSFHQPSSNRFYHSDLDLNQLNERFKTKLSISNQDINTSEGNLGGDSDWSRSNLLILSAINQTKDEAPSNSNIIEDVNYDKFLNDLLSNDYGSTIPSGAVENEKDEASGVTKAYQKDNELVDFFGNDLDSTLCKKTSARRIPLKKPSDKFKSFGSNPTLLGHHSLSTLDSNLAATTTTSTSTVHIPQLSRLDAIPTRHRRGKSEVDLKGT